MCATNDKILNVYNKVKHLAHEEIKKIHWDNRNKNIKKNDKEE